MKIALNLSNLSTTRMVKKSKGVMKSQIAQGQQEILKYHEGKKLTRKEAMLAMCYDCTGGYSGEKGDCGMKDCPLYPWMPYKGRSKDR